MFICGVCCSLLTFWAFTFIYLNILNIIILYLCLIIPTSEVFGDLFPLLFLLSPIHDALLPCARNCANSFVNYSFSLGLFFLFNWSIVALQCYVDLCCTTKWLSYTHISSVQFSRSVMSAYIHSFFVLFSTMAYHMILNIVSCAIHLALYPF